MNTPPEITQRRQDTNLEALVQLCDSQSRAITALKLGLGVHEKARKERELLRDEFSRDARRQLKAMMDCLLALPDGGLSPQSAEAVKRCHAYANDLVRLVEDHHRMPDTKVTIPHAAVAVVSVRDIVDDVQDAAFCDLADRSVVCRVDPELSVRTAPERLRQILLNLVLNAARHTPAGSPIEIDAIRVEGALALFVADRGPGLNEPADELCKPFRASSKGVADGHGLGLYLVRRITVSLGGQLQFAERRGGGLVARVVLPQRRGDDQMVPGPTDFQDLQDALVRLEGEYPTRFELKF